MTLTQKQVDHLLAIMDLKYMQREMYAFEITADQEQMLSEFYETTIAEHVSALLELPK